MQVPCLRQRRGQSARQVEADGERQQQLVQSVVGRLELVTDVARHAAKHQRIREHPSPVFAQLFDHSLDEPWRAAGQLSHLIDERRGYRAAQRARRVSRDVVARQRTQHNGRMVLLERGGQPSQRCGLWPESVGDDQAHVRFINQRVNACECRITQLMGVVDQHRSAPGDGEGIGVSVAAAHVNALLAVLRLHCSQQCALTGSGNARDAGKQFGFRSGGNFGEQRGCSRSLDRHRWCGTRGIALQPITPGSRAAASCLQLEAQEPRSTQDQPAAATGPGWAQGCRAPPGAVTAGDGSVGGGSVGGGEVGSGLGCGSTGSAGGVVGAGVGVGSLGWEAGGAGTPGVGAVG